MNTCYCQLIQYYYLQNTGAVAMPEEVKVDHSMKEGGNQKLELYQEEVEHYKVVIQGS